MPTVTPMIIDSSVATIATVSDTRAPCRTREKTSRPLPSTPSRWSVDGPVAAPKT